MSANRNPNGLKAAKVLPKVIPLRVPADLHQEIKDAAEAVNLSEADVMRQSIHHGLPVLKKLLKRAA